MKFNYVDVLWYLIILGIGFIIFVGYEPYQAVGGFLIDGMNAGFLRSVPFVGIILFWIVAFLARCGSLVIYLVIQGLELLWIWVMNSPTILSKVICGGRSTVEINQNDGFWSKATKRAYNAIPYAVIRDSVVWAVIAYVIDFIVNAIALSPVRGGNISDLFWVLATGQTDKLNWANILRVLGSLFALELLVIISFQIYRMKKLLKD